MRCGAGHCWKKKANGTGEWSGVYCEKEQFGYYSTEQTCKITNFFVCTLVNFILLGAQMGLSDGCAIHDRVKKTMWFHIVTLPGLN